MNPTKLAAVVVAALAAGLGTTLAAMSSIGEQGGIQRIETESAADGPDPVVAFADTGDGGLQEVLELASGDAGADADPVGSRPLLSVGSTPTAATVTGGAEGASPTMASTTTAGEAEPPADQTSSSTSTTSASTSTSAASAVGSVASAEAERAPTTPPASRSATTGPASTRASTTVATTVTTRATTDRPPTTGSVSTSPPPTSRPPTTQPPTTQPPSTTRPPTTRPPTTRPGGGGSDFDSIRNRNPLFNRFANVSSEQLPLDRLTIATSTRDNGAHPDGNFRMACAYSHFAYDDPIVFPNQPGRSHLHMFFGNTAVDAHTTTDSLVNSGGGSCNGFELNRSGYWTPALLDGKGNTIVPDQIILYYKTKHPSETVAMPQGLKIVAGNPRNESFTASQRLGWACGGSGTAYNISNRIPNNCGSDPVNAFIQFPFCWDGKNLDSSDHISHLAYVNDNQSCPGSHPVRLPQITILLYFPAGNTSGWYLSSDRSNGFNTGPGATLHADWFGGWNEEAMNLWVDGCIRASRNCSYGQTGTSRMLAKLNNLQTYDGPNVLPLP